MTVNKMEGYASRCSCCDKVLASGTSPINRHTGLLDDLCTGCRREVRMAVVNHDRDVAELSTTVWRATLGAVEWSEDFDSLYEFNEDL